MPLALSINFTLEVPGLCVWPRINKALAEKAIAWLEYLALEQLRELRRLGFPSCPATILVVTKLNFHNPFANDS